MTEDTVTAAVTAAEITALLRHLADLRTSTHTADPAGHPARRAALLARKADLLSRIADPHTQHGDAPAEPTDATRGDPPRNDIETTTPTPHRPHCPQCGTGFTRSRRQLYCSPACRQAAWRSRHQQPTATQTDATGPTRHRRETTVYACGQCEQRYYAQQWCHDCQRPCHRIDTGGLCPHCLLTELPGVS